jgi:hypothetical protein
MEEERECVWCVRKEVMAPHKMKMRNIVCQRALQSEEREREREEENVLILFFSLLCGVMRGRRGSDVCSPFLSISSSSLLK